MNTDECRDRLGQIFAMVSLPAVTWEVFSIGGDGEGLMAFIDAEGHRITLSRSVPDGPWFWYLATAGVDLAKFPLPWANRVDTFEDAAAAGIGVLAGVITRERLSEAAAA